MHELWKRHLSYLRMLRAPGGRPHKCRQRKELHEESRISVKEIKERGALFTKQSGLRACLRRAFCRLFGISIFGNLQNSQAH